MLAEGVHVGLGTDGCASNNDLDMFEETRLASLLAKGVTGSPIALPAVEAVAMATLYGARALHLDHLIGSLEPGKRADLIVVDMTRLHDLPAYDTTGLNVYSRLVYASKSADVRDAYINGKAVLRDRQLTTLDERAIIEQATAVAQRVNKFFVAREKSVLEKLVAIGGLEQMETYEVQAKGVVQDQATLERNLQHPEIRLTGHSSRDQYDTYFLFADASQGRLRYREDAVLAADGSATPLYTLTLTGPAVEAEYEGSVVLSRARYSATADRSLRFYREYFSPQRVREIIKHRERYHIRFKGVDFVVNLDWIQQPPRKELYAEIKSRTWSKQDAIRKAGLIAELFALLGARPEDMRRSDYVDLVGEE
jgi:5-methylthioadenosine/S-adenosylhomocysteine deaminase